MRLDYISFNKPSLPRETRCRLHDWQRRYFHFSIALCFVTVGPRCFSSSTWGQPSHAANRGHAVPSHSLLTRCLNGVAVQRCVCGWDGSIACLAQIVTHIAARQFHTSLLWRVAVLLHSRTSTSLTLILRQLSLFRLSPRLLTSCTAISPNLVLRRLLSTRFSFRDVRVD